MDDNADVLTRIAAVLASSCTIVGAVREGIAALKAAEAFAPDVIVLDISMPGMNGFELAARLRANGSKAALVFLSIHHDEEFLQAARTAGALGYVLKSRLTSDLGRAVTQAHERRPLSGR